MKLLKTKFTNIPIEGYPDSKEEEYYIPFIFSTTLYIEPCNVEGTSWKIFVSIKLFGCEMLAWHYRDEYVRHRYYYGE
jgi:hypothetical protein